MELIRYDNPQWVYLFTLLGIFVLVFVIDRYLVGKAMQRFALKNMWSNIAPLLSASRPVFKFILLMLAFSMMVVAAINPQTGSRTEELRREGVDIVVALDVSRSMLAQDVSPNRLERAKLAVNRLINQLNGDRFALVVFAGNAHTRIPLTADHQAANMLLRSVNTQSVSVQGTNIGLALERAIASFPDEERRSRAIILVSDGESHEGDPLRIAQLAAEKGIIIHTVGIGSREGAPIPVMENGTLRGFLRDNQGNTVITRYDEDLMRQLAAATGGMFRHGTGADLGLNDILEEIRSMEREAYETKVFAEYESRFPFFLTLALILLISELLIRERKNKWLSKIKIFQ